MKLEDVKKIAVIGSGAMGNGIAQVSTMAGYEVVMMDIKQEFVDKGVNKIKDSLKFLVGKEKIGQDQMDNILNNLLKTSLDVKEAVSDAQIVIEAVPEIMDLKKKIFKEVSDSVSKDTIIATNTSSMSITELATVVDNQERFVGMHFFNPVPIMKLVEVIYGDKTNDDVIDVIYKLSEKCKKNPVKVLKDRPGFIVNRINGANQALLSCILDEGKIKPDEVDSSMKKAGFKMAPFETMDFVGLDVIFHIMSYFDENLSPDFAPGKFIQEKLDKKELGYKSGKGIYEWEGGKAKIDTSKESTEITPLHFLSVQLNESIRVYKEGLVESPEDIDNAMKFGMNAFAGPFELAAGVEPADIEKALSYIADRYDMNTFKPESEITGGSFKTLGK